MKICSTSSNHRSKSSWVTNAAIALAFFVAFQAAGTKAFAQSDLEATDSEKTEYYTIDETKTPIPPPTEMAPLVNISLYGMTQFARSIAVSLLRWTLHTGTPTQPKDKYNRLLHFGRWINDPNDQTCYNTRTKVLIRDSDAPVSFKDRNHCMVERGDWVDPYAGGATQDSSDIQIDHMVPLKNAYMSGAWEWNYQTRCVYANFLGNKFHLIAASGHENMSKGDKAPDRYMPPKESYRCQYLENWLKIKLIWKLKMTPSEVEAIRIGIKDDGCDPRKFSLTAAELRRQRKLIHDYKNNNLCPAR